MEPESLDRSRPGERAQPYSEEAERAVLGSALLDPGRVMDLCLESLLDPDAFYVPAHRLLYETLREMWLAGAVIDVLTVAEHLRTTGHLEKVGSSAFLHRLVDETPTSAHAAYYIDIVRQKYLLRRVIACARAAEASCYAGSDNADEIVSRAEQAFLEITDRRHGHLTPWPEAVSHTMRYAESILDNRYGLTGLSTGFRDLDVKLQGLRQGEMIVLAARPSMGKTSLAMNIAENVALGKGPDRQPRAVGIFSLEMSLDALVMRMLCSHAGVSWHRLVQGYARRQESHLRLTRAASVLSHAPIYLDDTGGLEVLELRARARRMKKRHDIALLIVDYLQLLHAREYTRQGRQVETAYISGHLKAMAKELYLPVLVVSQLNRAPDQRDREGRPRLSDLRDSGAIEQDADVVLLLRRPCRYEEEANADPTLAIVDVAKQRNGPTGEVELTFEEEYTRFQDRARGVDAAAEAEALHERMAAEAGALPAGDAG